MSSFSQRRRRRYGRGRGRRSSGRLRSQNSNATSPDVIDVESVPDTPTCIDLTEGPDEDFVDLTNITPIVISSSQSEPSTGPHRRQRRFHRNPTLLLSLSDDSDGDDLLPVPFTLPDLPDVIPSSSGNNEEPQNMNNTNGVTDTSLMSPENRSIRCPVCLDNDKQIKRSGRQIVSTVCGHIFCNECLRASIQTQKRCPNCRKKLTMKQYHPIFI